MIEEELPDELENDLDDIEPVGDESQLYEHFRVVVDKGQAMVRVDKYLFERIVNASRNRIQKAAEDGFVIDVYKRQCLFVSVQVFSIRFRTIKTGSVVIIQESQ